MTVSDQWFSFLLRKGAHVEAENAAGFSDDPGAELRATARGEPIIVPLTHLGSIGVVGPDAEPFLQGQLTCDVSAIPERGGAFGAYCSPKGRVLATFLLLRAPDSKFELIMPAGVLDSIRKRLSMFVLRSKVRIMNAEDTVMIGLAGALPGDEDALAPIGLHRPGCPFDSISDASGQWLELPGGRLAGIVRVAAAPALWEALAKDRRPVGTLCWRWLDIRAGLPWIDRPLQEQLVPQMANIEVLGGVSFAKGCYTGQEVVARTQHLGRIKRRMYLAHVAADPGPRPGDPVYGADVGDQASGVIVDAAPSPDGGKDVLAVMQTSTAASDAGRVGSLDGPKLERLPLPYALP